MPWSMPLPPMQPTQEDIEMHRKAERMIEALEKEKERQRLRDQFAAAALTGLLDGSDDVGEDWDYRVIACRDAYNWADAMLEAREQKRPEPPEVKP